MIDSGTYTVYAASTPRDLPHINSTHFDRISFIMARPLPHKGISPIIWEKKWFSLAIIMIRIPRTSS